ncbi:hypothetical protein CCMSSC00406_0004197 [Pleurotus cornucopiae]|uniref:Uncharacterized protein n=1 Tax=Pleurotus cornucopiae TaxID=5321 RepID=A0ACB7J9K2_PLECO|nr:hypothetical protein CCMSSC00406_0004197 [Pleurotus cornucopiae]
MPYIFGLSAPTEPALLDLRDQYVHWLQSPQGESIRLADVVYTTIAHRPVQSHRLSISASTKPELVEKLRSATVVQASQEAARVAFVFSGQGSQYLGMGRSLYQTSTLFRQHIDQCHAILIDMGLPGVLPVVTAGAEGSGLSPLEEFQAYQTGVFAVEFALAKLWISWGLKPALVAGQGLGEYAALVVAGVLTLEGALTIVASRVQLLIRECVANSNGMLVVSLAPSAVREALHTSEHFDLLSISCCNSAFDCVISGPLWQLKALKDYLDAEVHCRSKFLTIPYDFASSKAFKSLDDDINITTSRIEIFAPIIPVLSNQFGEVIMPGDRSTFDGVYFARHSAHPMPFDKGTLQSLCMHASLHMDAWVDISPHATSFPMLESSPSVSEDASLESLRRQQTAWSLLAATLSDLYVANVNIRWRDVFSQLASSSCSKVPSNSLPKAKHSVRFQDEEPSERLSAIHDEPALIAAHPFLHSWAQFPSSDNGLVAVFETPATRLVDYVKDHIVCGSSAVCPVSVFSELVLSAISMSKRHLGISYQDSDVLLRQMHFSRPFIFNEDASQTIITSITLNNGFGIFSIHSRSGSFQAEDIHMNGEYRLQATHLRASKFNRALASIERHVDTLCDMSANNELQFFSSRTVFDVLFRRIITYGERYRTLESFTLSPRGMEAVAQFKLPASLVRAGEGYFIQPAFVEALVQVANLTADLSSGSQDAFLCSELGSLRTIPSQINATAQHTLYCSAASLEDGRLMVADVYAIADTGSGSRQLVAHLKGLQLRRVRVDVLRRGLSVLATTSLKLPLKRPSRSRETIINDEPVSPPSKSVSVSSSPTLVPDDASDDPVPGGKLGEPIPFDLDSGDHDQPVEKSKAAYGKASYQARGKDVPPAADDHIPLLNAQRVNKVPKVVHHVEDDFVPEQISMQPSEAARMKKLLRMEAIPAALQTSRNRRPPLFLVHDGSGIVTHYSRIGNIDRGLWGMFNPLFFENKHWDGVVPMAQAYAKHILNTSTGDAPILIGGWSFGGVLAYEIARQINARCPSKVLGILLIDSPGPIAHVPLSDSLIDSVVGLETSKSKSTLARLVKRQFQTNSRMLGRYDPLASNAPCPPIALLRSSEGFNPPGVADVPIWLADRHNTELATEGWRTLSKDPIKVIDIPGNHFEPFHPKNVRY